MHSNWCVKMMPLISQSVKLSNACILNFNKVVIQKYPTNYITHVASIRTYSTQIKKRHEEEPKPKFKTVYSGILTPQIKAVKFFSLSSSMAGIIAQPFLYNEIASTGNVPIIVAAYSFIGFFTFVTPVLLHLITRKYVTELYYNYDTGSYVARTVNFFCLTKETEFKIDDVKVPDIPGMFTTLLANGKPLFLDPRAFTSPEHYAKLMGYDKPIDLKLYETGEDKKD